jgi:hypothetical protein
MTAEELSVKLSHLQDDYPCANQQIHGAAAVIQEAVAGKNNDILLRVERALWPVKIRGLSIPTFIVPIRPEWAMHLFDAGIGAQHLFGGNPNLIFRVENAYYRSSAPRVISAPGRILWYVSKHTGKYRDTEAIRACSYVDEVVVDRPKPLFTRFRRLGVYRWNDLFKLANRELKKEIMGFRFTKTEMLPRPVNKHALQKLWRERLGKNFHIQCPIRISEELFFDLYSMSS